MESRWWCCHRNQSTGIMCVWSIDPHPSWGGGGVLGGQSVNRERWLVVGGSWWVVGWQGRAEEERRKLNPAKQGKTDGGRR